MKVLHLATHKSVTRGGAVQMMRLAGALAARGHGVKAVFNREKAEDIDGAFLLKTMGMAVDAVPLEPIRPGPLLAFRAMVAKEGFQVVHAHRDSALKFAFFSLWGTGVPLVAQRGSTYRPKGMVPLVLRHKRIARIVAVAHTVKESLIKEEIPEDKVRVVYGSVDLRRFCPKVPGDAVKEKLGIPSSDKVVGMVAALVGKKGYPVFLRAYREVAESLKGVHALMVGSGRPSKFVQEAGSLGEKAHFVGHKEDVENYAAAMNLVVCASVKGEGLTGSLREAMAMAKPVVSSAVSGNPEAVIPGVTGVLFPVGDSTALARAITLLLSSPVLAKKMGLNGMRLAARLFSDEKRTQIMESIYDEVCGC